MADRKAVIKNADMSEDMQQDAIDCATQALEKYNIEKDIAAFIKKARPPKMREATGEQIERRILAPTTATPTTTTPTSTTHAHLASSGFSSRPSLRAR